MILTHSVSLCIMMPAMFGAQERLSMAEMIKKLEETQPGKRIPTQSLLVAVTALGISLQFTPGSSDTEANSDQGVKPSETKMAKAQKADGSLDAGVHFKYDIKAQKEGLIKPKTVSPLHGNQSKPNLQKK